MFTLNFKQLLKKTVLLLTSLVMGTLLALVMLPLSAMAIDQVTNVQIEAGDAQVTLSWTPVQDAEFYRVYWGTESASGNNTYNQPTITTDSNDSQYTVGNLINGTTYYFSITAVDANSESEFFSEPEVSATPQAADSGDSSASTFTVDASYSDNETILLQFSEAVTLPANATSAFTLTYNFDGSNLEITEAGFVEGSSETQVLLTTNPQTPGGEYTLVIPADLVTKDEGESLATADQTQVFVSPSDLSEPIAEPTALESTFKALSAESTSNTEITVTFNNPIVLPPEESLSDVLPFTIINNDNPTEFLEVTNYTISETDNTVAVLSTAPQTATAYTIVVALVTDTAGSAIASEFNVVEIGATGAAVEDLSPPEDATDLRAVVSDLASLAVTLTFTPSADTQNDLAEYIVYLSRDGGATFQETLRLARDAEARAVLQGLVAEESYDIRLTARDNAGNESAGTTTSITLPDTGPGSISLLAFGSLALARKLRRKRK
jgi:hypothetical protein